MSAEQNNKTKIYPLNFIYHKEKKVSKCIFCSEKNNLHLFKNRPVCLRCLHNIRRLYMEGYFQKVSP